MLLFRIQSKGGQGIFRGDINLFDLFADSEYHNYIHNVSAILKAPKESDFAYFPDDNCKFWFTELGYHLFNKYLEPIFSYSKDVEWVSMNLNSCHESIIYDDEHQVCIDFNQLEE